MDAYALWERIKNPLLKDIQETLRQNYSKDKEIIPFKLGNKDGVSLIEEKNSHLRGREIETRYNLMLHPKRSRSIQRVGLIRKKEVLVVNFEIEKRVKGIPNDKKEGKFYAEKSFNYESVRMDIDPDALKKVVNEVVVWFEDFLRKN